jgi:DNA-binding CsgD family transcriptional regulator
MLTKKIDAFEKILLPLILESEAQLGGMEITFKGLELFHRIELLPHQCALLSTIRRKIRAQRNVSEVFGYSPEKFDHAFFTSPNFIHPDDVEQSLYLVRMALANEWKNPVGNLKTEYSFYFRCRHANGEYHLTRNSISTFNSVLFGLPTEALFIMSDFGKAKFNVPMGLIVNQHKSLLQPKTGKIVKRADIPFTIRERTILYAICMGESSKMIADKLKISKKTVDNVRAKLLEKSKASNVAELASKAVLFSWV